MASLKSYLREFAKKSARFAMPQDAGVINYSGSIRAGWWNTEVVAPADGWFSLSLVFDSPATAQCRTSGSIFAGSNSTVFETHLPARKGTKFILGFNTNTPVSQKTLYFYPIGS